MPKMKTNRAARKRFGFTGTGKIRRRKGFHNHILTKKTTKRKRSLRKPAVIHPTDARAIKRLLPYGG